MDEKQLSPLAKATIAGFIKEEKYSQEGKISVNPLVAKFATWYEKLRNVMEFREEEVILRNAIARILKRRILMGKAPKAIAEPLVRELVWARYFPDESLSSSLVDDVAVDIELHMRLRTHLIKEKILSDKEATQWMYDLLSSHIEQILRTDREKALLSNFMFQVMRHNINIVDDTEETKDAQVFLGVRKSFAKDDLAFLRYHLFTQYFGTLTKENFDEIAANFKQGYIEIQRELNYLRKETIYGYLKKRTAVFFILEDILRSHVGDREAFVKDEKQLHEAVFAACELRYKGISKKVRTAIIRSVFFLLLSKVVFAFAIEGTYESIFYGHIIWGSILLNIAIPPILMIIVGLLIRVPGKKNSQKIFQYINVLLYNPNPQVGVPLKISKLPPKQKPVQEALFAFSWFMAFIISFGIIVFILTKLQFNIVSQGVFVFFLAIVSFLSYRIALTSQMYTIEDKPGVFTPIVDFFFMPVVRVGSRLTEGISQINIFLFLFDFVIETPFKGLFGFFEQFFFFIHAKREGLE